MIFFYLTSIVIHHMKDEEVAGDLALYTAFIRFKSFKETEERVFKFSVDKTYLQPLVCFFPTS